jgi:hypothetical protein
MWEVIKLVGLFTLVTPRLVLQFVRIVFAKLSEICPASPKLSQIPSFFHRRRMRSLDYTGAGLRGSPRSMPTASSASSAGRHRGPFIPTVPCPDCNRVSTRGVSGTALHDRWVYYKCRNHGVSCLYSSCFASRLQSLLCGIVFYSNFNLHFVLPTTAWMQLLELGTGICAVSC